jgi:hypothetical protein
VALRALLKALEFLVAYSEVEQPFRVETDWFLPSCAAVEPRLAVGRGEAQIEVVVEEEEKE